VISGFNTDIKVGETVFHVQTEDKGEKARLSYAFLQLGMFGISVKYIDVWGVRKSDGRKVTEQFR
jgi:hypothetical protein